MNRESVRAKGVPSTSTAGVTHCTTLRPPTPTSAPPPVTAGTTTASETRARSRLVRVNLQAVMVSSPVPVTLTTVPPEIGP